VFKIILGFLDFKMFLPLKEGGVDSRWLKYGIKNSSNSTTHMEKPKLKIL